MTIINLKTVLKYLNSFFYPDISNIILGYYKFYESIKLTKSIAIPKNQCLLKMLIKDNKLHIILTLEGQYCCKIIILDILTEEIISEIKIDYNTNISFGYIEDNIYACSWEYLALYDDKQKMTRVLAENNSYDISTDDQYIYTSKKDGICCSNMNGRVLYTDPKYKILFDSSYIYNDELYLLNLEECKLVIYKIKPKFYFHKEIDLKYLSKKFKNILKTGLYTRIYVDLLYIYINGIYELLILDKETYLSHSYPYFNKFKPIYEHVQPGFTINNDNLYIANNKKLLIYKFQ